MANWYSGLRWKDFSGTPRTLLGIEGHLLAFYDQPELMHEINRDLCDYNLRLVEEICEIIQPQFMTFAEDLSYNHGPMLSKGSFDEFLAPYFREMIPAIKKHGVVPFIDSDGDIMPIIPWLEDVGIEGILPLERMAGVDVARAAPAASEIQTDRRVRQNRDASRRAGGAGPSSSGCYR